MASPSTEDDGPTQSSQIGSHEIEGEALVSWKDADVYWAMVRTEDSARPVRPPSRIHMPRSRSNVRHRSWSCQPAERRSLLVPAGVWIQRGQDENGNGVRLVGYRRSGFSPLTSAQLAGLLSNSRIQRPHWCSCRIALLLSLHAQRLELRSCRLCGHTPG